MAAAAANGNGDVSWKLELVVGLSEPARFAAVLHTHEAR